MTKNFDSKSFKIKHNLMAILCILICLIGVTSVILSFVLNTDSISLKDNFYGTYYACGDNTLFTFTFDKNSCNVKLGNGIIFEEFTSEYKAVTSEYANKNLSNPMYKDKDAIFVYKESNTIIPLWIIDKNYTFKMYNEITNTEYTLTKTPITMSEYCGDTEDYYGTYYSSDNKLQIKVNNDYTAQMLSYETTSYPMNWEYCFVNENWLKTYYPNQKYKKALCFFNNEDQVFIFGLDTKNSLILNNMEFTKIY